MKGEDLTLGDVPPELYGKVGVERGGGGAESGRSKVGKVQGSTSTRIHGDRVRGSHVSVCGLLFPRLPATGVTLFLQLSAERRH